MSAKRWPDYVRAKELPQFIGAQFGYNMDGSTLRRWRRRLPIGGRPRGPWMQDVVKDWFPRAMEKCRNQAGG